MTSLFRLVGWLDALWALRSCQRKNPLHPDLPMLIVRERERRP